MKKISDILHDKDDNNNVFADYFKLVETWKLSIPSNILKHTSPVKLSAAGMLIVFVDDNIYLQELNYLKDEFIQLLNQNHLPVTGITYKYVPLKIKNKEIAKYRYELTDDALRIVTRATKKINDTTFKDEFESAMKAYFTRYTVDDYKGR